MDGLTFRIALSAACAGGDHDRCAGIIAPDTPNATPCACLHHRTDVGGTLDRDAAGMLTEQLAAVGCIEQLERVADYVDARWPGRRVGGDLVEWMAADRDDDDGYVSPTLIGVELVGSGFFVRVADVDVDAAVLVDRLNAQLHELATGHYFAVYEVGPFTESLHTIVPAPIVKPVAPAAGATE